MREDYYFDENGNLTKGKIKEVSEVQTHYVDEYGLIQRTKRPVNTNEEIVSNNEEVNQPKPISPIMREPAGKYNTAKRETSGASVSNAKPKINKNQKKKHVKLTKKGWAVLISGGLAFATLLGFAMGLSQAKTPNGTSTQTPIIPPTEESVKDTNVEGLPKPVIPIGKEEYFGPIENTPENNLSITIDDRIADLVDYKKYLYKSTYDGDEWYYVTPEKMMEISYFAMEKMEHDFAEKGVIKPNNNGQYIAEWMTPMFLTAIAKGESSLGIEDANGNPLKSNKSSATGCTQILNSTADDIAEKYAEWSSDKEFAQHLDINGETDPRSNPYYAMCMTVTYFEWMNQNYMPKIYKALNIDPQNMTEEDIRILQNVAAAGYYAGISGVKDNILSGKYKRSDFSPDRANVSSVNNGIDYCARISAKYRELESLGASHDWKSVILSDGSEYYYLDAPVESERDVEK